MNKFPPTLILRHRKENKKKCSLTGLEKRSDIRFYPYPWTSQKPNLSNYFVLAVDAPLLSKEDAHLGIFLIDGTWRYAQKMLKSLPLPYKMRSLPKEIQTAYPRRQDVKRGLASIEALYVAHLILGRKTEELLDNYLWKTQFCDQNNFKNDKS